MTTRYIKKADGSTLKVSGSRVKSATPDSASGTPKKSSSSSSSSKSSSSSSSKSSNYDYRKDVIQEAKEKGVMDSQGRIKQGKQSEYQAIYTKYQRGETSKNLVAQGMGVPVTQKKGSDRETTRESIERSATLTAQGIADEKTLRGEQISSVGVTVSSQALNERPEGREFDRSSSFLRELPFLRPPPAPEPDKPSIRDEGKQLAKQTLFFAATGLGGGAIAGYGINKIRQGMNWVEEKTDQIKDSKFSTINTDSYYGRLSSALDELESKGGATKIITNVIGRPIAGSLRVNPGSPFSSSTEVLEKIYSGNFDKIKETSMWDRNVKAGIEAGAIATVGAYSFTGGGQVLGASARAGLTGVKANIAETVVRTAYSAAKAKYIYEGITKGTPAAAGFINPDFKAVYDSPEFSSAIATAQEARRTASYEDKSISFRPFPFIKVNIKDTILPVKGLLGELPFVNLKGDVFETTLRSELSGTGVDPDIALQAAGLRQFSRDVGFTVAAISIESQSELFGRTGIARAGRTKGPVFGFGEAGAREKISSLVKPSLQRAGITEGVASSVLYDTTQGQDINFGRAVVSGALGGFIAGELGTFIAKTRIGKKRVSYLTEVAADIIDLPEFPGDVYAGMQIKGLRSRFNRLGGRGFAGVSIDDIAPTGISVGKVRTPVGLNIFGIGTTPQPESSFSFSESSRGGSSTITPGGMKTTSSVNFPVTVPETNSFFSPATITSSVTVPTPAPTPVPVTSSVTIPNIFTPTSSSNTQVPTPVPVPATTTTTFTNINIPVAARDRFPYIPFFGGGGRGKSKSKIDIGKGATKTVFQNIFKGINLKPITAKKGRDSTGILLRG